MHVTKRLPDAPDGIAPDGSEVRLLASVPRGSLAHFLLAPGQTSVAVHHRTVDEMWYFVGGHGQMWRHDADGLDDVVDVEPGSAITIPLGTHFQFRATGNEPLAAVGCTMPPWPGHGEAVASAGKWPATVGAGPGLAAADAGPPPHQPWTWLTHTAPFSARHDPDRPATFMIEQISDRTFSISGDGFQYNRDGEPPIEVTSASLPTTDFASIPRFMAWLVSRYGRHTPAALVHDQLVSPDMKVAERKAADATFRRMLEALE